MTTKTDEIECGRGHEFPECVYCDDRAVTSIFSEGIDGSVGLKYLCQYHFEIYCESDLDMDDRERGLWD
jgi:hypothetical protein